MGDLSNILSGGQSGAYNQYAQGFGNAGNLLNQFYQQGIGGLSPYMQAGSSAIPQYQQFLNQMKGQMNGNWMNQYQQSPYAKYATNTALNSMNNAAAATGTLGSGANQQENAQLATQISSQDMQNYFNNMQSQNQMYMGGLGNMMGMGMGASEYGAGLGQGYAGDMASMLADQYMAQGNSQAAGTQGKESALGGILGMMGGMGGSGRSGMGGPGIGATNVLGQGLDLPGAA